MIGEEMKKRLIDEGLEPSTVKNITTVNDKKRRKIITTITFNDDTKHNLVDDFIWFAARDNKRW